MDDDLSLSLSQVSIEVPLPTVMPGQVVFGHYRLERPLGRGGFGVVWLARDEDLQMKVALKFMSDLLAANQEALMDLKREARNSLKLTHPNIVRIHALLHEPGFSAISMEYVDGKTLSALKIERPARCFDAKDLAPVVTPLCLALEYAHSSAMVVHRDLKPGNVMRSVKGEIKVTDFGISRSISDTCTRLTQNRGTMGTPAYMSPQQMMGEPPSPMDDVYSLGATLYDLLSGRPPFYSGDIPRQVWKAVPPSIAERRAELEIAGQPVPPAWEKTIAACLEKDPARRPQSALEIAAKLGLKPSADSGLLSPAALDDSSGLVLQSPDGDPGSVPPYPPPERPSSSRMAAASPGVSPTAEIAHPRRKRVPIEWFLLPLALAILFLVVRLSARPVESVEPATVDFGTVAVNASLDRSFTIANKGRAPLKGDVKALCEDFEVVAGAGPFSLGPGQSMAVTVRFTPDKAGRKGCAVSTGLSSTEHVICSGFGR